VTVSKQFQQLEMFNTASVLRNKLPGDYTAGVDKSFGDTWKRKEDPSFTEHMREQGAPERAVKLSHTGNTVLDGHHTIVAAHNISPNYVLPVQYVTPKSKRRKLRPNV